MRGRVTHESRDRIRRVVIYNTVPWLWLAAAYAALATRTRVWIATGISSGCNPGLSRYSVQCINSSLQDWVQQPVPGHPGSSEDSEITVDTIFKSLQSNMAATWNWSDYIYGVQELFDVSDHTIWCEWCERNFWTNEGKSYRKWWIFLKETPAQPQRREAAFITHDNKDLCVKKRLPALWKILRKKTSPKF